MKLRTILVALAVLLSVSAIAVKPAELEWTDMKSYPLYGTVAHNQSVNYVRVPDSLKEGMRKELYDLATNTAGMYIRFATDASAIGARWKATKNINLNHMPPTGIRGRDPYTLDNGKWTTVSSCRPSLNRHTTETVVIQDMEPTMREYMLYLPLYDGVDSIAIGVNKGARMEMPKVDSPRADRPIVMYGTSILQGGCATRPGMVHTSILSRDLDRQVINLGFSGNAKLDQDIARLIGQTPASVIVIDALPNNKTEEVEKNMEPFIATIRQFQPTTPILLVESPIFPLTRFNLETRSTIADKNAALRKIFDRLAPADPNLHYFRGEDIFGDCVEGTVDNYHFTDLGFTVYARNMLPVLRSLLKTVDF